MFFLLSFFPIGMQKKTILLQSITLRRHRVEDDVFWSLLGPLSLQFISQSIAIQATRTDDREAKWGKFIKFRKRIGVMDRWKRYRELHSSTACIYSSSTGVLENPGSFSPPHVKKSSFFLLHSFEMARIFSSASQTFHFFPLHLCRDLGIDIVFLMDGIFNAQLFTQGLKPKDN